MAWPDRGLNATRREEITVCCELCELARVRDFVAVFCRDCATPRLDEDFIDRLVLAANEATSNVILHACGEDPNQFIWVTAVAFADRICLRLCYTGDVFDPETVQPPVFDGSRESGFGLYIIKQCVDRVAFRYDREGRASICLTKIVKGENRNGAGA